MKTAMQEQHISLNAVSCTQMSVHYHFILNPHPCTNCMLWNYYQIEKFLCQKYFTTKCDMQAKLKRKKRKKNLEIAFIQNIPDSETHAMMNLPEDASMIVATPNHICSAKNFPFCPTYKTLPSSINLPNQ